MLIRKVEVCGQVAGWIEAEDEADLSARVAELVEDLVPRMDVTP